MCAWFSVLSPAEFLSDFSICLRSMYSCMKTVCADCGQNVCWAVYYQNNILMLLLSVFLIKNDINKQSIMKECSNIIWILTKGTCTEWMLQAFCYCKCPGSWLTVTQSRFKPGFRYKKFRATLFLSEKCQNMPICQLFALPISCILKFFYANDQMEISLLLHNLMISVNS